MAKVKAIKVRAHRNGFRRGGIAWGKKPITVALADISKENLKLIRAEERLSVQAVEIDGEEEKKPPAVPKPPAASKKTATPKKPAEENPAE